MIQLRRGINLGGFLSQCVHTRAHYDSFIVRDDIKRIKDMGYDHVRLPIDYEVFETEDGERIGEGYNRVHEIIGWTREYDLPVILDLHRAYGYDFNDAGDDAKNMLFSDEAVQDRFVRLWENIAREYMQYDNVAFELLNEVVEDKNADAWNRLIARALSAIRAIAPDTPVIYGGIKWNSADTIRLLEPVTDPNVIVTFHFYEPLVFTHQHAHWMPVMEQIGDVYYPDDMSRYRHNSDILGGQGETVLASKCDHMDIEYLREMVQIAVDSARELGAKHLYVGEYGVIDKAPAGDMLRWMADTIQVFKENNIGCALWSYKLMDFGIDLWDTTTSQKLVDLTRC